MVSIPDTLISGFDNPFDRPVVILAAPRSGSTLLFETLSRSPGLWTIGGESHGVFERIRQFNPLSGLCDSNALSDADASPEIVTQIRASFLGQLRDSRGQPFHAQSDAGSRRPRLLEKTPKNALRVGLLNRVFPDALFIYLYRNPRENISSMIDAWQSNRFITYRKLPGRSKPWSLLLPPGWQQHHESTVAQIAAFQWQAANTAILQELGKLEDHRWTAVSYGQQVLEIGKTVQRICEFCEISCDEILEGLAPGRSLLSRYTLTEPAPDKWHRNARALSDVMPGLAATVQFIREAAPDLPEAEFDVHIDPTLVSRDSQPETAAQHGATSTITRNSLCHCGSGKRFKHCHGDPRPAGAAR